MSIRLGIITDNEDPSGLRRVRVSTQDRGVGVSDWIPRITGWDGSDAPVPPVGSSVVIAQMDGDTSDEICLGVLQCVTSNKPDPDKPTLDHWTGILESVGWFIRGFLNLFARGVITLRSDSKGEIRIKPDGEVRASNPLGSATLLPNGYLIFSNPYGTWEISGSEFRLSHPTHVRVMSPSFTWNGQTVAVVGGVDSRGDTTLS